MTMVAVLVVLAVLGFVGASVLFGADSRSADSRCATPDWPGVRHGG
jgi:type II secretory pathway pseudopilin PulG